VLVADRDDVLAAFYERGVFPGVHYRDNSEYAIYHPYAGGTPRAAAASETLISLPLHLHLSDDDIDYVGQSLVDIVR
jgi:dTDP-4-amino-4,6-dideoxygalactose transaminase